MKQAMSYDIAIIGGGIVGLSTAWQLLRSNPDTRVVVIEKENQVATHQTGRNSGVIHAGVYYQPGSLKAKYCKEGALATKAFCKEQNIDFNQCGKLIVATNDIELERMRLLEQRCIDNGINIERLNSAELIGREPNISGLGALFVSDTAIVNYQEICHKLEHLIVKASGVILKSTNVVNLSENSNDIAIYTTNGKLSCRYLVSCAGLQSDKLTDMIGIKRDFQIIPFRGEYYRLPDKHRTLINHLIYPVPDPNLPFLGVHLTRMIDGSVTVGPNAVLGWKREGYGKLNFSLKDSTSMISFVGFWKLMSAYWKTGLAETKNSWFRRGYLTQVQKYCKQISLDDLQPYPAGIRAQAVLRDGSLVHDFLFAESERSLHVCNAPSPAATSALPIGKHIIEKLGSKIS